MFRAFESASTADRLLNGFGHLFPLSARLKLSSSLLIALLCSVNIAACGEAEQSQDEVICDREPALNWHNFGQGFITQNCLACHHSQLPQEDRNYAPSGVDFETYEQVLSWAERIEIRTLSVESPMPPGGGLSEGDLLLFAEWMGCQVAQDSLYLEGEAE